MTQVLHEPDVTSHDDDLIHYICDIHEDLALCGEQLGGEILDAEEEAECRLCLIVLEAGWRCAVPGCPGRRRLRRLLDWLGWSR